MIVLMEDAMMHNFPADCETYWDFCDKAEVKELGKQLQGGLIHPLEYAAKIRQLALQEGFTDVWRSLIAPIKKDLIPPTAWGA